MIFLLTWNLILSHFQLFIRASLSRYLVLLVPIADALENGEVHLAAVVFVLPHDGFGCWVVNLQLFSTLHLCTANYLFDLALIAQYLLQQYYLDFMADFVIPFAALFAFDWSEKWHRPYCSKKNDNNNNFLICISRAVNPEKINVRVFVFKTLVLFYN